MTIKYKDVDQLQPGDRVMVNLPCVVTVTDVEEVNGSVLVGNMRIVYEGAALAAGEKSGAWGQGSRTSIKVLD